ncbi:type II secretory pathway component PulM [Nocardioides zeae]|uniref:Type II secretory pathway component PulM n=1 Tax=Nocardioides zeae TaxID=1457234 RepID=A0ACC6IM61_9ACTN|nr:hypothetical protein [Nocardioides zeae]MDR6173285.1 type II secretory pathway component PulM [Nocardioides zeae]MDR6211832.1 type II secretory pathway component PulM [Nocardioides zeae]
MGPLEPSTLVMLAVLGLLSGVFGSLLGPTVARWSPRHRALLIGTCALLVVAIIAWVVVEPL